MTNYVTAVKQPKISLQVKSVIDACEAIYQDKLSHGEIFIAEKHLRFEDIREKRIEMGARAGSNTTLIKGRDIWLDANEHRFAEKGQASSSEQDPMFAIVKSIRADLAQEAKHTIAEARGVWQQEKDALLEEVERLQQERNDLEESFSEQSSVLLQLQTSHKNLQQWHDEKQQTLAALEAKLGTLQAAHNQLSRQHEDLQIRYQESEKVLADTFSEAVAAVTLDQQTQRDHFDESLQTISKEQAAENDRVYGIIRDKDEQIVDLQVKINNLEINLAKKQKSNAALLEQQTQTNQMLKTLKVEQEKTALALIQANTELKSLQTNLHQQSQFEKFAQYIDERLIELQNTILPEDNEES